MMFLSDDELIQVRFSSQLDLSDLGTNAKRLATLRKQIRTYLKIDFRGEFKLSCK
jgi:uncharacterized protein (DUF1499 family)